MILHMVDIQDGNGCRQRGFFELIEAQEKVSEYLNQHYSAFEPSTPENIDDAMDRIIEGETVTFANGASVRLSECEVDMSGVLEVIEDAKHTLDRNHKLLNELATEKVQGAIDRANSRHVATEQALYLTAINLRKKG